MASRGPGVTAKDLILGIIGQIGAGGASATSIEYAARRSSLSMEGRMTVCNMSIEAGARAGMIAPDETTFAYLGGRPAPPGGLRRRPSRSGASLPTDEGATFDTEVAVDAVGAGAAGDLGHEPGHGVPVTGRVPDPASRSAGGPRGRRRALVYWRSSRAPRSRTSASTGCSSAPAPTRASRTCARPRHGRGQKVAPTVNAMVVPGSQQ